jgi:hypothetical protein
MYVHCLGFPSVENYQKQTKKTACVLPGGQLQLADEPTESTDIVTSNKRHCRPSSWHGKTCDMIDLLLDSYDVIDVDVASTIDSMSVSQYSAANSSSTGTMDNDDDDDESYSDGDMEIDLGKRLSEYTIIPPIETPVSELNAKLTQLANHVNYKTQEETINLQHLTPNMVHKPLAGVTTEGTYSSLDAVGFRHSDSDSS